METIDKVSISTALFAPHDKGGVSMGCCLDMLQQSGFEMIEVAMSHGKNMQEIEDIRKSGIKVWAIHGTFSGPLLGCDTELQAEVDKACRRIEAMAEFAPCPVIEHYIDRSNDPLAGRNFRSQIEKLYNCYSKLGFTLCLETAPYKPQIDERYPDSREITGFVRSFGKDDLRLIIDINHSNLHEDLEDVCRNGNGIISSIHVSDNMGEWEDHMPPGTGVIDLKKCFAALRANGYSGPCNLEFVFPDFPAVPKVEAMRDVREYVEQLLWEKK